MALLFLLFVVQVFASQLTTTVYDFRCLEGFSTEYIESCEKACGCEWGYCKKCCKLTGTQCSSHEPLGWTVGGQCKSCDTDYSLDLFQSVGCNDYCGLYLDAPSSTPFCCKRDGDYCYRKATTTCSTTTPTVETSDVLPPLPTTFLFPKVSTPLNQGACGNCYVMATVAALADRYSNKHDIKVFSPQTYTTCGQEDGCGGGSPIDVYDWHVASSISTCQTTCSTGCHPFFSANGNALPTITPQCPSGFSPTCEGVPSWCAEAAGCDTTTNACPTSCINYNEYEWMCSWTMKVNTVGNYNPCDGQDFSNPGIGRKPSSTCKDGSTASLISGSNYQATWYEATTYILNSNSEFVEAHRPYDVIEKQLRRQIFNNGPISSCYTVKDSFLETFDIYPKAIYTKAMFDSDNSYPMGHCVRTVGWGTENNIAYWFVANSWGTDWADGGFFRIQRGVDTATFETRITTWMTEKATTAGERIMIPQGVNDGQKVRTKHRLNIGGGEWRTVTSVKEGVDVVDFIMEHGKVWDHSSEKLNGKQCEIKEINNIQKQVVDNEFLYRTDFVTVSDDGEIFNHVDQVSYSKKELKMFGKPVVAKVIKKEPTEEEKEKAKKENEEKENKEGKNKNKNWNHKEVSWSKKKDIVLPKKYNVVRNQLFTEKEEQFSSVISAAVFIIAVVVCLSIGYAFIVKRKSKSDSLSLPLQA